jgi:hypothetical protein
MQFHPLIRTVRYKVYRRDSSSWDQAGVRQHRAVKNEELLRFDLDGFAVTAAVS